MARQLFDETEEDRPGGRAAPAARAALSCAASGCPWRGSSGENGRFVCIAHAGSDSSAWPAITDRTVELQWFAVFIADMQRLVWLPRRGEPGWIDYADQFWNTADHSMKPQPDEMASPSLYLYRMLGELRAMALGTDRPQPHVPQCRLPEFLPRQVARAALPPADPLPVAAALPLPARPLVAASPVDDEPPAWATEDAGLSA